MLARLVFGLVLGLLMYIPRPVPKPPTDTVPPSPDELPPGEAPDGDPPIIGIPLPDDLPSLPGGHKGPWNGPSVPPTPPPGYDGEWPPASEHPDLPPTPPPGHTGPWPGNGDTFQDRIRDLIRGLRELLRNDQLKKAPAADVEEGVTKLLGTIRKDDGAGTVEA